MFYKAKASVIIFVLLIVLLFAISECKRAGGGGRIFRTTILKGRRNSRRSRDLYTQQMMPPQWPDPLSNSNRPPDESLQTSYYNRGEDPIIYVPYDFSEHKKEVQSGWVESVLQEKSGNWDNKLKFTSQESMNSNLNKDDESFKVPNDLSEKRSYSLQGYPFEIITNNNENKQHIINPSVAKYDQTLNMNAIETDHYRINITENNDRLNQNSNPLLNVLLGKPILKDGRNIRSLNKFSTERSSNHNNSSFYTYNYYNYPKGTPEAVTMPATRIRFCQKDFSSMCTAYTFPICTSYGTVMCIALEQQLVPCVEGSSVNCFNTRPTIDSSEIQDLQESSEEEKTDTLVKLPCITKMTITVEKPKNEETFKRVKKNGIEEETTFCVVTVLIPKAKEEPDK